MMTGTIRSRLVEAEQLGAIGLTEAGLHLPELQQRLRDPAQIFNVRAGVDRAALGLDGELTAEGEGFSHGPQGLFRNDTKF